MLRPPPPPDWTGVYEGACRLPELVEEFDVFEELAEPEPDVPPFDDELPARDAALELDELFVEVVVLCAEPGRTTAITPAVTTLAKPTVAVVAFSRRRPRSRSATARERLRAAPRRDSDRARDDPSRNSWLLISLSLARAAVGAVHEPSQHPLIMAPQATLCASRRNWDY